MFNHLTHVDLTPRGIVFLNLCAVLVAVGFSVFVLHRSGAHGWRSFVAALFPPGQPKLASIWTDVVFYLVARLKWSIAANFAISITFGSALTIGLRAIFGPIDRVEPGLFTLVVIGVVLFVIQDFLIFLMHRLQHTIPILWEFHKVHHSATYLSPLTGMRFHPAELLYEDIIRGIVFSILVGAISYFYVFNLVSILLLSANLGLIITYLGLFPLQHSHLNVSLGWFDGILISPAVHQIHHSKLPSHYGSNYGSVFSIWDFLFGTLYIPAKGERLVYGIGEEQADYDSPWRCLYLPFVRAYRISRDYWRGARIR